MAESGASSTLVASFVAAGIPKAKAESTAKNGKLAAILAQLINDNDIVDADRNPKQGNLLLHLAGIEQDQQFGRDDSNLLAKGIHDGRLQSLDQVNAGVAHLKNGGDRSQDALDKACGVGVVVSPETVNSSVAKYMGDNAAALAESTWASLASSMSSLKLDEDLRWASPLDIKKSLESAFTAAFGTKEDYNKAQKAQSKSAKAAPAAKMNGKEAQASTSAGPVSSTSMFQEGFLAALHPVGGNPQIHPHLREKHMKATGGLVHTRFPPEPNGYLHIGHSKAIAVNFGFAQFHKGHCYLRYDDTNPEAEEQVYLDSILDIIRWLGFEPWKITYSSDHFQKLYDLAEELTRRGKAYMCYCTAEQINAGRGGPERGPRKACVHRDASIEDNLSAFRKMKDGGFAPSEAVLRMKQDFENPSPQMWDLIAYRTLRKPHHRTGDEWCIYPTYDFTHCLCDSFENITHSLCTTEFILSRESYEWLCDALEIYKPKQSEYGRLDLEGTFLSKRKIAKLVDSGLVSGWDDPRLYTLIALRRRGVPPGAILSFVNNLGVTTTTSQIALHRYEHAVRSYLEMKTPRLMLVLKPLKVTLINVPDDFEEKIEKPLHSKDASMGSNTIYLTKNLYIDADDFREQDSKEFFRLAPGKTVGLLYASRPITCVDVKKDAGTGEVVEVMARYEGYGEEGKAPAKVKTYIHWVAEHAATKSPVRVEEARFFKQLFKSSDPASLKDYIADIDPDSLQITRGAMLEVGIWDLVKQVTSAEKTGEEKKEREKLTTDPSAAMTGGTAGGNERVRFQGLRTAYFCLDKEAVVKGLNSTEGEDKVVLNCIVSLKEDKTK